MSAQDKQLCRRRFLQLRILHLARVARESDVMDDISKAESAILAGVLQTLKFSHAQVDTAQMSLPVRLSGLGSHLFSDHDVDACDATFLAALTCHAMSASSELYDLFNGASGVLLTRCLLSLLSFGSVLLDGLSFQGCRRVECVADVTAGSWLDALPVAFSCVLGDADVVSCLRYVLAVCLAAMQDTPHEQTF